MLGGIHGGAVHQIGGLRTVVVVLADGAVADEVLPALELALAAGQLRFGRLQLGGELLQPVRQVTTIHQGQGLTSLNAVALLDVEGFEDPLAFGADVDEPEGL